MMLLIHHSLTQVGFSYLNGVCRLQTGGCSKQLLTPCCRFGLRNLVSFLSVWRMKH